MARRARSSAVFCCASALVAMSTLNAIVTNFVIGRHRIIGNLDDNPRVSLRVNERIVITGLGALSPNGVGRETYFQSLVAGRSGIRNITRFDAASLPARIAGEVDFDPDAWVDQKNMRHVSRVVPMAIAATDEALRDAKLDPSALDLETRRRRPLVPFRRTATASSSAKGRGCS